MQDYTNFIKTIERTGRVSIQEAEELTARLLQDEDEDIDDNLRIKVYDIFDKVLTLKQNGDVDDYHNYSVTLGNIYDYDAACQIIECGLQKYPYNVDLLADFLNYSTQGSDINCWEKCWEYYERLLGIDVNEWSWRCYAFIINFLKIWGMSTKNKEEKEKAKNKALEIAEVYIKKMPSDNRAYFLYYKLSVEFNPRMTEKRKYELLNKIILKSGVHSIRCSILLAEMKIENKEYLDAIKILDEELHKSVDPNSFDVGHVYLLRCIAKAAKLIGEIDKSKNAKYVENPSGFSDSIDSDRVAEIQGAYLDYDIAKKASKSSKEFDKAKKYIRLLEILSGVENDSEFL